MTLAEAITQARAGEMEGFVFLLHHTAPTVWLAASVLGCPQVGTALTQIYRKALTAVSSLRSPSDLRVWLGRIAYGVLLEQPDCEVAPLPVLTGETGEAYRVVAALPRQERTALLLLCAEGCSAPQAADILSCPEIEIKRAMRRARQSVTEGMKAAGCEHVCNTAWLISVFERMCETQRVHTEQLAVQVMDCVQSGAEFEEAQGADEQSAETTRETEEKGGFFQKLFRSKRFG